MEETPNCPLRSRKNEAHSLHKSCFKNELFLLVPFEIWKDIVTSCDLKVVGLLSQTCWGLRELVEDARDNNIEIALRYRREGQISRALKCLQTCVVHGNSMAMFHIGFAYLNGGWGLKKARNEATEWFKKAAERGSDAGKALYALRLICGDGAFDSSNLWGRKALSSGSSLAAGYCYYLGLGTLQDQKKAFALFELAAEGGDEYGQYMLGICYQRGDGVEVNYKSLFWYSESARQGLSESQFRVGLMYRSGVGCIEDDENAGIWYRKAGNQAHESALLG